MPERTLLLLVMILALIGCKSTAEQTDQAEPSDVGPVLDASAEMSWQKLVSSPSDELHERLGSPECDRDRRLPRPTPETRAVGASMWLKACDYSTSAPELGGYAVDRIRWSGGEPAVVWLVAEDDVTMGDSPEFFGIPEPTQRRATSEKEGTVRVARANLEEPPVVVEVVSQPGSDLVRWVKIYVGPHGHWSFADPYAALLAKVDAPRLEPRGFRPTDGVVVTHRDGQVSYGHVHKGTYSRDVTSKVFEPEQVETARAAWFKATGEANPAEALSPPVTLIAAISADGALLDDVVSRARQDGLAYVAVLGQGPASDAEYVETVGFRLVNRKPLADPLLVAIGANGFDLLRGSDKQKPIEGCPADGPTVCQKEGTYDWDALAAAIQGAVGEDRDTPLQVSIGPAESIELLFGVVNAADVTSVHWSTRER